MADPQQAQPDPSQRVEDLVDLVRQQSEAIESLKTQLSKQITKQIAITTQQLEAHQALQALIGDVAAPLHGWPISPDFALQLVRLIRDNDYHLIIEFGSGTSTLLGLRAIEKFGLHSAPLDPSLERLLTFEHLDTYHQKTTGLVSDCSNRALLNLCLSPLGQWADATGNYSYYSGIAAIAESIHALSFAFQSHLKLLVVIDGPPGATCHWARYPAIPIVLDAASGMDLSIDFLLDDMIRTDEKEIAMAWEHQFKAFGIPYQRVDYNFEKGGLLLATENLSGIDTSLARAEAMAAEKREQEAIAEAIARVDELLAELEAAKQSSAKELQQTQQARDAQAAKVKGLDSELASLKGERDLATKEKVAAQQSATELKQQLATQAETLQQIQQARDEQTAHLGAITSALHKLRAITKSNHYSHSS
jgi:hypothetical protein